MFTKKLLIALATLSGVIFCSSSYAATLDTSGRYMDTTIRGWKVYVSTEIYNPLLVARAYDTLDRELGAIQAVLPREALSKLMLVSLWLDYTVPPNTVSHYYSESPAQLKENGWDLRKEGSIGTQIVDYVNASHDSLPLLKWFAYAYLYRELGLNNMKIILTFEKARQSDVYDFRFRNRVMIQDEMDYFAILSEAYFAGKLSYPPYGRERLKAIDPDGYNMLEKMWGIKN
jgi:hypothetical protein